jgi:hypothetical protein
MKMRITASTTLAASTVPAPPPVRAARTVPAASTVRAVPTAPAVMAGLDPAIYRGTHYEPYKGANARPAFAQTQ